MSVGDSEEFIVLEYKKMLFSYTIFNNDEKFFLHSNFTIHFGNLFCLLRKQVLFINVLFTFINTS